MTSFGHIVNVLRDRLMDGSFGRHAREFCAKRGLDPTKPLPRDLWREMTAEFADKVVAEARQRFEADSGSDVDRGPGPLVREGGTRLGGLREPPRTPKPRVAPRGVQRRS